MSAFPPQIKSHSTSTSSVFCAAGGCSPRQQNLYIAAWKFLSDFYESQPFQPLVFIFCTVDPFGVLGCPLRSLMIVLDRTDHIKHSFSSSFPPQTRHFQNYLLSDTFCLKGFPRSMNHSVYGFLYHKSSAFFFVPLAFVSGFSPYILLISSAKPLLPTLIYLLKSIVESLM